MVPVLFAIPGPVATFVPVTYGLRADTDLTRPFAMPGSLGAAEPVPIGRGADAGMPWRIEEHRLRNGDAARPPVHMLRPATSLTCQVGINSTMRDSIMSMALSYQPQGQPKAISYQPHQQPRDISHQSH